MPQAFVEAPLEEAIYMRLPPGCGELFGKDMKLVTRHKVLGKPAGSDMCS